MFISFVIPSQDTPHVFPHCFFLHIPLSDPVPLTLYLGSSVLSILHGGMGLLKMFGFCKQKPLSFKL